MFNIGIDLGGTNIKIGVVSSDYTQMKRMTTINLIRKENETEIASSIEEAFLTILNLAKLDITDIDNVGICVPGLVENNVIIFMPNLPLKNVNLIDELKKTKVPPIKSIINDADAAAIGEYILTGFEGKMLILTLGTGIGSGLIYKGKLLPHLELGHMKFVENGRSCHCGESGCLEQYLSSRAFGYTAEEFGLSPSDNRPHISAKEIFELNDIGNPIAKKILNVYIENFANALDIISTKLNLDRIVLSGGVAKAKSKLITPLRKKLREDGNEKLAEKVFISDEPNLIGLLGAAKGDL